MRKDITLASRQQVPCLLLSVGNITAGNEGGELCTQGRRSIAPGSQGLGNGLTGRTGNSFRINTRARACEGGPCARGQKSGAAFTSCQNSGVGLMLGGKASNIEG